MITYLLILLTIFFPAPRQNYHGPSSHTRSRDYYARRLNHLQAQRQRHTARSHGPHHPARIR